MSTSAAETGARARAVEVQFRGDDLVVVLDDGRCVALDLTRVPWLAWLQQATPAQRRKWTIEPSGFAIYWDELDDGIEVCHLLGTARLA